MADEMDESMDAEEKGSTPKENMAEGVEASAAGSEQRLAGDIAGHDTADAVGVEALAPADAATERPPAAAAASTDSAEAFFDAAPNVDQPEPHGTRAASAGASTKNEAHPRVEANELDMPGLDLLYDVELDATLQFGSREMLLRDVLELGPGDVVELDRHIAQPVDLVVGDRIVARGEVVVASGNFALRVTEVAAPQMRLESIRCLF
jgi:flagellar motor switch protein FliN/FliY